MPPLSWRGGILSLRGRERIPGVPVASQEEALSNGKARGTPESCHDIQSPPEVSVLSRETFPWTASTFKPRIDSHHCGMWDSPVGKPRGKASLESLVGKPRGNATDPFFHGKGSVTLLLQLGRKVHLHAPLETSTDFPGEIPGYPKIHVSTGEESSGSGIDSTQGLRPRHRQERNPERPQSNSQGNGLSRGHQSVSLRSPS